MTSFREQMRANEASRMAVSALEASARMDIERLFQEWGNGGHSDSSIRWELEGVVRRAYRSSALVAREAARLASDLPGWEPDEVDNSEYLQSLLSDVRRNLRAYKSGELAEGSAVSRIQHSAGVAAQRGHTDQTISAYSELEDFGMSLKKYWVANFVDNTPCPSCRRLHGTSVGLNESFSAVTGEPNVYMDLVGPPRHPRCQCKLVVLISSLENAFEHPDFEDPQDSPDMISAEEVRKMPKTLFTALLAGLKAVLKFLGGRL